jgi:hypothetical protein
MDTSAWDWNVLYGCLCDSSWPVGYGDGDTQLAEYYGADCSLSKWCRCAVYMCCVYGLLCYVYGLCTCAVCMCCCAVCIGCVHVLCVCGVVLYLCAVRESLCCAVREYSMCVRVRETPYFLCLSFCSRPSVSPLSPSYSPMSSVSVLPLPCQSAAPAGMTLTPPSTRQIATDRHKLQVGLM